MKRFFIAIFFLSIGISFFLFISRQQNISSGAPPYEIEDLEPKTEIPVQLYENWKRPTGPAHVGLQVGHWKNNELPDELERLRGNTGASSGKTTEWEVNLAIAQETKSLLEQAGVVVDILPATIPPAYQADAFIAIHADGNTDTSVSGYKIAAPRRDYTKKASSLKSFIETAYGEVTHLSVDPNISRNMTGYYAFAFWRHEHAVHPMTTAVILETGFLTNPSDRKIIVQKPELSAKGLADGIILYLKEQQLLPEDV